MGTSTLPQTKTIFKVAPRTAIDAQFIAVDGVVCAIPASPLGRATMAVLGDYANEVEQARDEFVQCAKVLSEISGAGADDRIRSARDAYAEAFETLQRTICKSWRAQQVTINQYRVAAIRGGVAFYASEV